ncbi:hypothetical protein Mgra_00004565 [Meloidogyne graminicola]|uniref:Uncharacterized protein n=1 Tax=Meloidogyne graminicola TaxID=189291 RepID=A0A8S9ZRZ0_9BILA|nr:hypothetical protein Mgra_00004565 [Meloidogyne graminicola]
MIDCHCHLADSSFNDDIEQVISRAKEAGLVHAIVVAEYPTDFPRIFELAKQFPDFIKPCLGVHPVQKGYVSVTQQMFKEIQVEKSIRDAYEANLLHGIGEVGLDFTPRYLTNGNGDKDEQRAVFSSQIELAKELGLTLNVHSRSAGKPVIELLQSCGAKNVLLHAFTGNIKSVRLGVEADFHFSLAPAFTNKEKEEFVRTIPLERLCLESDSPVLGPNKFERNEPANIRLSAEFIAKIKGIDVSEVIRVTSANAKRLFRLPL